MWAVFRTASTQIRLNAQLDEVIKNESGMQDVEYLDDYSTMYSQELTGEDCKMLKKRLEQVSPNNFTSTQHTETGHLNFEALSESLNPMFS